MIFIMRAIFWLAVVSAILPPRDGEPDLGETAGKITGAAVDYCVTQPATCINGARNTMATLRIPADFIAPAQNRSPNTAIPTPLPRPASL